MMGEFFRELLLRYFSFLSPNPNQYLSTYFLPRTMIDLEDVKGNKVGKVPELLDVMFS